MKILISTYCDECSEEAEKRGNKYLHNTPPEFTPIELNENGIYSLQCPNNHTKWFFLQEQLFQILFDLGVLSVSDGYTREAVSSFATSLERFYEFIIKLILLSDNIHESLITKYWNVVSKQSERQFGSYLSLFSYKFNQLPPFPSNKWIEFRNDIMHKGKIPSESITIEYGQLISDLIFDILFLLKDYYKEDIHKNLLNVYKYNSNIFKKENPQIKKAWYGSYGTTIQLRMINSPEFKRINVASEVEKNKLTKRPIRISYVK